MFVVEYPYDEQTFDPWDLVQGAGLMAIAALSVESDVADPCGVPWPKPPALRLVGPPVAAGPAGVESHGGESDGAAAGGEAAGVRTGTEVSRRRRVRAIRRARLRRSAAVATLAGLLVVLALPLSVLGGRPSSQPAVSSGLAAAPAAPAPAAAASTAGHVAYAGQVAYVVKPGDTLWSIASRIDRGGDVRGLVRELAAETGSEVVRPGERVELP